MQVGRMKKAANENIPLLRRHPRLLKTPVQQGGCSRQQDANRNTETAQEDVDRELSVIEAKIKWLNWMEFALRNKRTAANDSQVRLAGRNASKRIS